MASYPIPAHLSPQAAQGWGNQYASGARIGLAKAQLVQQAIRQAQAMRQAQAELEQRARQFEAQQEARHQAELRRQQELEIESAHKEILLGLRERELENRARMEARKITDAANRSAAMLKISQQNADTARMRADDARKFSTTGFTKQDISPGHYSTRGGGHFEVRDRNQVSTAAENALRGGLASAQAVLSDGDASAEAKAVARSRADRIMQQLGEEVVAEPMPGTGSPEVKRWWPRANTPAVAPTMTNYVRKVSQPVAAPAATATNAPPLPRFKWVNGALEPVKAIGKEDEAIDEEVVEEDEEMALADEEE